MRSDQSDIKRPVGAKALEGHVWTLIEKKDLRQAAAECDRLNLQYPDFASGWHTASQLAMKLNNPAMALLAIDKALSFDASNMDWQLQRAMCLMKTGQTKPMSDLVEKLSLNDLTSAYQYSTLAMLMTQLGLHEPALRRYERAASLEPKEAKHFFNIACLQRTLGDTGAAEQNFDEAIRLDPAQFEAYKLRSELRKQSPARNHVASLERLLSDRIPDQRGKVNACYALAKELEDLGEVRRAFRYLKMGADTRRSLMQYDVKRDLATMASIRNTFGPDLFNGSIEGNDNSEAIFILGMPRTGTTLVERILSSHTDVFAAGELNNFAVQMMSLVKPLAGDERLSRDELVALSARIDFRKLGESYINSTRPFTGHTARFIDKLPLNYLYVGLIHLALPNAKIISLKRHPLDTCYAIYKQLFLDAYPFSYDLEELGRYYVAYYQLTEHWQALLPCVIHTIEYETLVNNIGEESRRLLDFCGLDWQPQCLKFYENPEASTTASTVQVRQPVYQSSVGKWLAYEEQLAPLIDILEAAGIPLES